MDRRKFLTAGGAAAGVAALSGFGGQYLQNKRFSVNTASVKLGKPAVTPPTLVKGTELNDIAGNIHTSRGIDARTETEADIARHQRSLALSQSGNFK